MARKRTVSLLGVLLVICAYFGTTHAQDNKPQLIYSGVRLAYLDWLTDGAKLLFLDSMSVANAIDENDPEKWQSYAPNTEALTQSALSPLRTTMTDPLREALKPPTASRYPTITPVSYLSPNGRYLVYVSEQAGNTWRLSLADLQSGQSAPTDAFAFESFVSQNLYRVLWNDTSTAFAVTTQTSWDLPGYTFYVGDFSENLSNIATQLLQIPDRNGRSYMRVTTYDLSDDGKTVLMMMRYTSDPARRNPESQLHFLTLWQADNPTASQLIETVDGRSVIGAAFAPGDESKILFVDENGLSEYDLTTNVVNIINGNINAAWVRQELDVSPSKVFRYRRSQALFSPDGKWLALYLSGYEFNSASKLYVLPTGR